MSIELNQVVLGDCLDHFKEIPDNFFDMSFADPPFNLHKKYVCYKDSLDEQEYFLWCKRWIAEVIRVTKPSGTVFLHNIPKWLSLYTCILQSMGMHFRHWIAWDAPSSPMGRSLQPSHYGILYYVKNPELCKVHELRMPHKRCRSCKFLLKDYGGKKHSIHPFGPLVSDVWTDIHRCKHGRYRDEHPCQLPVHLMERLILLSTDVGDNVLDCFMGVGTTAIAAKRLGRNWYGMELSESYANICRDKVDQAGVVNLNGIHLSCYANRIFTVRDKDIWDREKKEFKQEWTGLYKDWPDTDEKRRLLNVSDLEFKEEIQVEIFEACLY